MGLPRISGLLTVAVILGSAMLSLCLTARPAGAVPSFARQTGLACEACHTVFPELTPFGRRFKLNAYTLTTRPAISAMTEERQPTLSLADVPPISLMFQGTSTWLGKTTPDTNPNAPPGTNSRNGTVEFPQALSFFYAGKIADHFGALFQVTYTQPNDHFSIDNSDIRYANQWASRDLLYGVTFNNNPTVQDVWNSTPAWSPPYIVPPVGPTPAAAPLITKLGAQVAGLGAYVFYKDSLYAELSVYHAALTGKTTPIDSTSGAYVNNYMPYWRVAYERDWRQQSAEIGTFGTTAQFDQGGLNPLNGQLLEPDAITDIGIDGQYQYIGEDHIATAQISWIHETQNWNGLRPAGQAANSSDNLQQFKLSGSYYYKRRYGVQINFTRLWGSTDQFVYPIGVSSKGNPTSQWETLEVDYLPFLNTKLFLQYTIYQQFNGGSNMYDGVTNRNASDNNAVLLGLWTNF